MRNYQASTPIFSAILAGILGVILAACVARFEVPNLEPFGERNFELSCENRRYFLAVSETLNFELFDAAFAPVISRELKSGSFKNRKFLPPNADFDELFVEILKMIKDEKNENFIQTPKISCEVRAL